MAEILTQLGFDKLLATLDVEREQAGAKYESLRLRLIKFFEWRNCEQAEALSANVFDRIIKKISTFRMSPHMREQSRSSSSKKNAAGASDFFNQSRTRLK